MCNSLQEGDTLANCAVSSNVSGSGQFIAITNTQIVKLKVCYYLPCTIPFRSCGAKFLNINDQAAS